MTRAVFTAGLVMLLLQSADSAEKEPLVFTGMCDASAAAAIGGEHFVVADDEENLLRVYRRSGGEPLMNVDLRTYLGPAKGAEADLEGAAAMGNLVFWIGSHGRNARGKESPSRQRLFATRVDTRGNSIEITPLGRPYVRLLQDLLDDDRYAGLGLRAASERAPKESGGLNIEGLATTPDGHLLVGFRNPLPGGKAIVAPVLNPLKLIEGENALLGPPFLLDLGGLGIRSLGWFKDGYLIIAGSAGEGGGAKLYKWEGGEAQPRLMPNVQLRGLNPEGVVFGEGQQTQFLVLSDDGTRQIDGEECKSLTNASQKRFRGMVVRLP
jgi:hypothetical protein